jgi:hypothetical protein
VLQSQRPDTPPPAAVVPSQTPGLALVVPPTAPPPGSSARASHVAAPGTPAPGATQTQTAPPTVHAATTPPQTRQDLQVVESGFSVDGQYINYTVVVHNPNTASHVVTSAPLQITFYSGSNIVTTKQEYLGSVLLDQTTAIAGFGEIDGRPDRMDVKVGDVQWDDTVDFQTGELLFHNLKFKRDIINDIKTSGTAESTFSEQQSNVQVVAVYRDSSGKPLGADFTYLDFIDPGATIGFEISGLTNVKGVASVDVYFSI